MANTTNYNWETPDDTDLVKDGAAAIRTLGSSVDTTTKALNPSTTLGDIEYRSATANTNTRLAIGTTGQVLSVVGGVPAWATSDDANAIQNAIVDAKGDLIAASAADTPARLAVGANGTILTADSTETTGLKWAAPAGGGALTKITSAAFSAQSSVAIDGCFTSTYTKYFVVWQAIASSDLIDLQIQFRYAGPTTQTSDYYAAGFGYNRANSLITFGVNNQAQITLCPQLRDAADGQSFGIIYFDNVGNTSELPSFTGHAFKWHEQVAINYSGLNGVARTYTGFLLKPASGTITGTYAVYGLGN